MHGICAVFCKIMEMTNYLCSKLHLMADLFAVFVCVGSNVVCSHVVGECVSLACLVFECVCCVVSLNLSRIHSWRKLNLKSPFNLKYLFKADRILNNSVKIHAS